MARRSSHSTASRLHVWLVLIECRLDWNEWIFETFHGGFPLRSHPLSLRGFAFSVYIIGGKVMGPIYHHNITKHLPEILFLTHDMISQLSQISQSIMSLQKRTGRKYMGLQ